jgi:hypothetical protein
MQQGAATSESALQFPISSDRKLPAFARLDLTNCHSCNDSQLPEIRLLKRKGKLFASFAPFVDYSCAAIGTATTETDFSAIPGRNGFAMPHWWRT